MPGWTTYTRIDHATCSRPTSRWRRPTWPVRFTGCSRHGSHGSNFRSAGRRGTSIPTRTHIRPFHRAYPRSSEEIRRPVGQNGPMGTRDIKLGAIVDAAAWAKASLFARLALELRLAIRVAEMGLQHMQARRPAAAGADDQEGPSADPPGQSGKIHPRRAMARRGRG